MSFISYMDDGILYENVMNGSVYKGAVYDFTFDDQYIIYHVAVPSGYEYYAFDYYTKKGSCVTHTDGIIPHENYERMLKMVALALTYTGKRYDLEMR